MWLFGETGIGCCLKLDATLSASTSCAKLFISCAPSPRLTTTACTAPPPEDNLRILGGGDTLALGTRKVAVVYTPGHASHHVSYFDNEEGAAFVGDTTGVRIEGHPSVMPATPPPDIDLDIWDTSFAAILERKPARLFLTHFGFSA